MQKGGAEFRFVLWDLGVHVLCLPSPGGRAIWALRKAANW